MQVFAHRGNQSVYPENSMAAFESAVAVGADGIECDVHLTKDGQLIVMHDETLDRTSDQQGALRELDLVTIQQARLRYPSGQLSDEVAPTLAQLLDYLTRVGFKGCLNIELKTDEYEYSGIEAAVLQVVQSRLLSYEVVFSSFNWLTLQRLKQLDATVSIALLVSEALLPYLSKIEAFAPTAIHLDIALYQPTILAQLAHYPIRLWTVNAQTDLVRFMTQPAANVVAIMTDYPKEAIAMRSQRSE